MSWVIGIRPSRRGAPPLLPQGGSKSAADRLRIMLGLSVEDFLSTYQRDNAMDPARGRRIARTVTGDVFVFGLDAWRYMGLPAKQRLWEEHVTARATFHLLPHPSGRNRLYNSTAARARLRRVMQC